MTASLAAVALSLSSACSKQDQASGERSAAPADAASSRDISSSQGRRFDKKAAATLSLTSAATADFDSEYARAKSCASAIRTTIGIVRDYRGGLGVSELRALERAEQLYVESAIANGKAEDVSEQRVRSEINEASELGRQSAATQVQLSLACLQRLG